MSGAYGFDTSPKWSFAKNIAAADGDTSLQATPGATSTLMVQGLIVNITTAAAQAFDIENDGAGTIVELFKAPASLAVGSYAMDFGPLGIALAQNTALEYDTAAAGPGLSISGFGYVRIDS